MRELVEELKRLARDGQYNSLRFREVLAQMNRIWEGMNAEEREALLASEPDLLDSERFQVEPELVVCDLETWIRTGPDLVGRHHELKAVDLIDQQPTRTLGAWSWVGVDIPAEITAHLPNETYTTEMQAMEGLSTACLRWARAMQEARYIPSQN